MRRPSCFKTIAIPFGMNSTLSPAGIFMNTWRTIRLVIESTLRTFAQVPVLLSASNKTRTLSSDPCFRVLSILIFMCSSFFCKSQRQSLGYIFENISSVKRPRRPSFVTISRRVHFPFIAGEHDDEFVCEPLIRHAVNSFLYELINKYPGQVRPRHAIGLVHEWNFALCLLEQFLRLGAGLTHTGPDEVYHRAIHDFGSREESHAIVDLAESPGGGGLASTSLKHWRRAWMPPVVLRESRPSLARSISFLNFATVRASFEIMAGTFHVIPSAASLQSPFSQCLQV
ncbi:hypothetical protein F5Y02DRAFT_124778 [Annulohypoxylon stygium]|nr:hypothetical protein F5Y02DRAFT_124778 [Annulohypoxylon stygium]